MTCPDANRPDVERGIVIERERLAKLLIGIRVLLAEVRGDVVDPVRRAKVDATLAKLGGRRDGDGIEARS